MLEKFAHVFPAMVTPMNEDGSFNYEVAKKHANWMMDNGIGGIGVLMAAGEYQSMSLEEHMEYVNIMVPYIKKRGASVIVGCSRERVEDACALMNNAYKAGADAAMVLPSFYYNQSQEEIIDHYTYLNDNSDLDIMVYKLPHVKIVKDASMVIDVMTDFIFEAEEAEEEKNVLCGCDYLLYQAYATGAVGWISMTANILPKLSADFHNAMIVEKDYQKGLEIYKKLYPVVNMTERYPAPTQAVKHILSEVIGFDEGICRRPRREISDEDKAMVVEWSQIRELAKTNKM